MRRGPFLALVIMTLMSTGLRLGCSAINELNKDEGYNSLYASHLDWSYFDHPPMMMIVTKLGITLGAGIANPLSIRLGFVLAFSAAGILLAYWTASSHGDRAGVFAALLFHLSPFFLYGAGATVMPDAPFLLFGIATMWAVTRALEAEPGQIRPWIWVGCAWAGALLSKYHAVFFPAGAVLYLIVTSGSRKHLLRPGPYLATLIGFLGFAPVLVWNMRHGWASFVFQGQRAFGSQWQPVEVGSLLLGQMVLLSPGLWCLLLIELISRLVRWRSNDLRRRLAICWTLIPMALFLAVALKRHVAPHWSLVGFVPLYPFLGARVAGWSVIRPRLAVGILGTWATMLALMGLGVSYHTRYGLISIPSDPTIEMSGWTQVIEELDHRQLIGRPNTFLFTGAWHISGRLGYELQGRMPVLCYSQGDARGFAFWSQPEQWLGQDGILVSLDDIAWEPEVFRPYFRKIEYISDFEMTRDGEQLRHARIFRCVEQTRPFPYAYPTRVQ